MLMHEWISYRDQQLERVKQYEEDEEERAAIAEDDEQRDTHAEVLRVAEEVARRADETQAKRLQAIIARQQRLPLDVKEPPPQSGKEASSGAKESREELIERLLDPTLTLSETATLVGVCPTTVRRYTKRGVLKCFRTPGNQRRFRLSDVLDFIERQQT